MALFIILTPEQADQVRGPTTPPAVLMPVERQGGVYILGVEVLADAAHAEWHDYLAALPTLDISDPNFPPVIEPPDGE